MGCRQFESKLRHRPSFRLCVNNHDIGLEFCAVQWLVLPNATLNAFLVAYGELAIGTALVFGVFVRTASVFGVIYMLSLLFSSNFSGGRAQFWQYFGASLDHSVLALCFLCFIIGRSDERLSLRCLLLLWQQARREGIRLIDLFGIERSRLGREVLWGLLYSVILFPIVAGFGSKLASWLVNGTTQLTPHMLAPGLLSERQLPHWAVIYSLSVFWLVWSPTEEVIYQAYCVARLRIVTGSAWATVTWVRAQSESWLLPALAKRSYR
jgi:hypothetical protein